MTTHELKTWPEQFTDVARGAKKLEIRLDDRGYEVGDVLELREWDPATGEYTGNVVTRYVSHIVRGPNPTGGIRGGYVAMSICMRYELEAANITLMVP